MFHSIDEFLADWANEFQSTIKVFKSLTNESLSTKVYPEGRTLGFLAWHITNTIGEMMSKGGLDVKPADGSEDEPVSVEQIVNEYEKLSQEMVKSINEKWSDDTLNEEFPMYGEVWKGRDILMSLVKHQIHHRAQMTVLMRQFGLKVPGIYGPAKEDWAIYGMPTHK